jgi:hypothetical protein
MRSACLRAVVPAAASCRARRRVAGIPPARCSGRRPWRRRHRADGREPPSTPPRRDHLPTHSTPIGHLRALVEPIRLSLFPALEAASRSNRSGRRDGDRMRLRRHAKHTGSANCEVRTKLSSYPQAWMVANVAPRPTRVDQLRAFRYRSRYVRSVIRGGSKTVEMEHSPSSARKSRGPFPGGLRRDQGEPQQSQIQMTFA